MYFMDISFKRSKPTPDKPTDTSPTVIKPNEDKPSSVSSAAIGGSSSVNPSKPSFSDVPPHKRLKWIFFKPEHVSRKKWLLVNLGIVILLVLAVFAGRALYKHFTKLPPNQKFQATQKKEPTTEASRLTGVQVNPKLNDKPITGVMIENSPDARPQSGLLDAGVVIEAIAEGGITRFLALYQEGQPDYIGPIRSVRPYYLDFALAFNASVAHVGGSPEALGQIRGLKVRDLDQFHNAGAYRRVAERYAPHNVYTSMRALDALNKKKGFNSSKFDSFPRKKDQASSTPTATSINIAISSYYYNTHYNYDRKTNSYKRQEGGANHMDQKSKKQLSPKVVIAMVTDYGIASDGAHSKYRMTGSGNVVIFQDGIAIKGKWSKKTRSSQITFTDAEGKAIRLNAGQTWITLVGNSKAITYRK